MLNFLLRRTVFMFVALFAVSVISFFIINLPKGDYVTAYIAQLQATGSLVDAEEAINLRKFYGLDINNEKKLPNFFKIVDERIYGISKIIFGKFLS